MKENNDEKKIGKLIEKRKTENDAFQKLLNAIEGSQATGKPSGKKNIKK